MRKLALALILALPGTILAQTFSLVSGREPATSLDGLWHFHTGDNPAWADPNFDDSNWPLVRSDEPWTSQGYPAFNGYAWYRFRVQVPGDGRPVDLLLPEIVNGYQLYADGRLIGSAGSAVATPDPVFQGRPTIFALPTGAARAHSVAIALRVWTYYPIVSWTGSGTRANDSEVGDPALLSRHLRSGQSLRAQYFVTEFTYSVIAGLIGLAILALFLLRTEDKEYLWFSILLLAQCANAALHLMLNLGSLPMPLWDALRLTADASSVIAAMAFFSIVLGARRSYLWWTICLLVAAAPLTAALIYSQLTGMGVSFAIEGVCILPAYLWIIVRLVIGAFRKDVSARLLLVPVTLSYGLNCAGLTARIALQLTGKDILPPFDVTLFPQPFPVSLYDIVALIFFFALLVFLVRRFSLARKEEERLAAEFEAARTVQSLLIPAAPAATPGFTVENVYLPAQEVGGDFFQVLPGDDGSLLIVVGDVSGKGLKAAMTVSAIIGALRGCTARAPARVLDYLNSALHGQVSGFFTCCAALIGPKGTLTIANAGHLAPYLNGEELAIDPGLPLGITTGTSYAETTYCIGPGDRLTFVSDGVVEAQSATGELFGFDRTRNLSTQSADAIAQAAQQFGQEDDITVLSIRRVGAQEAIPA